MNTLTIPIAAMFALLGGTSFLDAPVRQDPTLRLDAGFHDARELVDRFAKFLGRNILYDYALTFGAFEFELQQPLTLTRANCEEVVEGLMWSKQYVFVPLNIDAGLWELVSARGGRRSEIQCNALSMSATKVLENRRRKVAVQCALPLRHVDAMFATAALRPLFAARGRVSGLLVGNVGTDYSLMLSGVCDEVAKAIDVIRELDVPPDGKVDPEKRSLTPSVWDQVAEIRAELGALTTRIDRLEVRK